MSKTRRHIVRGLSPEYEDHEWTGCGWGDKGHGKRYDKHDAEMVAFDANCAGDWTAWREEASENR